MNKSNDERVVRLAYNTNCWEKPSGEVGKSKNEDTYENETGYANEEWLFNPKREIDGYRYAYIQGVHTYQGTYTAKIFDMYFYTISPNKERVHIATVKNVECISQGEGKRIHSLYKEKGWLEEMEQEVSERGKVYSDFNPNIKYKKENIEWVALPILNWEEAGLEKGRYNNMKHYDVPFEYGEQTEEHLKLITGVDIAIKLKSETGHTRYTPEVVRRIAELHNKMQNVLVKHLQRSELYQEDSIQLEHNFVDVKARTKEGDLCFFELKTSDSAGKAIREALGQILEYQHKRNRTKGEADRLYIVAEPQPTEEEQTYLKTLRELYNLPLWYRSLNLDRERLSKEY